MTQIKAGTHRDWTTAVSAPTCSSEDKEQTLGILLPRQIRAWKTLGLSTGTLEDGNDQFLQPLHVHSPSEDKQLRSLLLSRVQPAFYRPCETKLAMDLAYKICG